MAPQLEFYMQLSEISVQINKHQCVVSCLPSHPFMTLIATLQIFVFHECAGRETGMVSCAIGRGRPTARRKADGDDDRGIDGWCA